MNEPDQIDRMLSDYFKSEAPTTWPSAPRQSSPAVIAIRTSDPLVGGRIALAASILMLLAGSWWLVGWMSNGSKPASFEDTTATRPADMQLGK